MRNPKPKQPNAQTHEFRRDSDFCLENIDKNLKSYIPP